MGIAYVVAAFGVVPALLFVFDRLSRARDPHAEPDDVPFADLGPQSVADEAERWLQNQG